MNFKPADEEQRVIAKLKGMLATIDNENEKIKIEFLNMSEDHARLVKAVAERDALLKEKDVVIVALQECAVIVTENHGGYKAVQCTVCEESGWETQMTHKDNCAVCFDTKTLPSEALDRALAAEREKCAIVADTLCVNGRKADGYGFIGNTIRSMK